MTRHGRQLTRRGFRPGTLCRIARRLDILLLPRADADLQPGAAKQRLHVAGKRGPRRRIEQDLTRIGVRRGARADSVLGAIATHGKGDIMTAGTRARARKVAAPT